MVDHSPDQPGLRDAPDGVQVANAARRGRSCRTTATLPARKKKAPGQRLTVPDDDPGRRLFGSRLPTASRADAAPESTSIFQDDSGGDEVSFHAPLDPNHFGENVARDPAFVTHRDCAPRERNIAFDSAIDDQILIAIHLPFDDEGFADEWPLLTDRWTQAR